MHKHIVLLGLLMRRPMYGQQIREVIEVHHEQFAASLKKPTIYYQLDRLVEEGFLEIRREAVEAPGPGLGASQVALREREIYHLTPAGEAYFFHLVQEALLTYIPGLSDLEVSLFFLQQVAPQRAIEWLEERKELLLLTRERLIVQWAELSEEEQRDHHLINDHSLTLLDAEISWISRSLAALRV